VADPASLPDFRAIPDASGLDVAIEFPVQTLTIRYPETVNPDLLFKKSLKAIL
jgi:hypothetical protein